MKSHIRKATVNDIEALCSLTKELKGSDISYVDMQNRLQFVEMSPFDFLYVYEEDDHIFGFLGFRIRENLEDVTRYGKYPLLVLTPQQEEKELDKF